MSKGAVPLTSLTLRAVLPYVQAKRPIGEHFTYIWRFAIARASDRWTFIAKPATQLERLEQLGRVEALEIGEQVIEGGDVGADDVIDEAPC